MEEFQFCLVGICLTDGVIHFQSLRNTLAELWHPIGGVFVKDLGDKRILFQFFHEVDIQRVLSGTPWFFNNHLILFHRIKPGEDPSTVLLVQADFWVQIHEPPPGLLFENMAKQFGSFWERS